MYFVNDAFLSMVRTNSRNIFLVCYLTEKRHITYTKRRFNSRKSVTKNILISASKPNRLKSLISVQFISMFLIVSIKGVSGGQMCYI